MSARTADDPLSDLREAKLAPLVRVADRLFADRMLLHPGHRPMAGRAGRGMDFLDHCDYVPGEDLRRIDWRASARSRVPQLRRYQDERVADWVICLDASASVGLPAHRKWRLAVQLAACVGYLLLHLDNRVALLTFGDSVDHALSFGRGRAHYARLARLLRGAGPRTCTTSALASCARHIAPLTPVVVISDCLAPDGMWEALARLLATGRTVHVLQVADAGDARLDGGAPCRLRDVESGDTLTVTDSGAAEAAAQAAQRDLAHTLAQRCRDHGVLHRLCPTEAGWRRAALDYLRGLHHA